jgi:hypothetical protein
MASHAFLRFFGRTLWSYTVIAATILTVILVPARWYWAIGISVAVLAIIALINAVLYFAQRVVQLEEQLSRIEDVNARQESQHLIDLVAELRDNERMALRPEAGGQFGDRVYVRPSNQVWLSVRNRIQIPEHLRQNLENVYSEVGRWQAIVDSGLRPGIGSQELNTIAMAVGAATPDLLSAIAASRNANQGGQ